MSFRNLKHRQTAQQPVFDPRAPHSNDAWASNQYRDWSQTCKRLQALYGYIDGATVPHNWSEWITHARESNIHLQIRLEHRICVAEEELIVQRANPNVCLVPFRGKTFSDNRSAVLCQETIWRPFGENDQWQRPGAHIWPSAEEYSYEGAERRFGGDKRERATRMQPQDYRRHLPMLRNRDTDKPFDSAKLLERSGEYELDAVRREPMFEWAQVPGDMTNEDTGFLEKLPDEVGAHLLGSDLFRLMNNGGEPVSDDQPI